MFNLTKALTFPGSAPQHQPVHSLIHNMLSFIITVSILNILHLFILVLLGPLGPQHALDLVNYLVVVLQ